MTKRRIRLLIVAAVLAAHSRSARGLLRLLPRDEAALVQPHCGGYRSRPWRRRSSCSRSAEPVLIGCSARSASRSWARRSTWSTPSGTRSSCTTRTVDQTGKFGTTETVTPLYIAAQPKGRQHLRRPTGASASVLKFSPDGKYLGEFKPNLPKNQQPEEDHRQESSGRPSRWTSPMTARCTSPRCSRATGC